MIWWMIPHEQNTVAIPVGATLRCVFNCPATDKAGAIAFASAKGLGHGAKGVRYKIVALADNHDGTEIILAQQVQLPAAVSPVGVAAAQVSPHGQAGQTRPSTPVDSAGFQYLGDDALPVRADGDMFGDSPDGTFTDIVQIPGGGFVEQPRPTQ